MLIHLYVKMSKHCVICNTYSGNNLVALPVEMSRPFSNDNSDSFEIRYPSLERLWLDDNKLSDQTTFATLAGLRKYVNYCYCL